MDEHSLLHVATKLFVAPGGLLCREIAGALAFGDQAAARRFLERHACEPAGFEVVRAAPGAAGVSVTGASVVDVAGAA